MGSRVAYRLAGMGYEVVVLEQRERLGEQVCCTGIVGQECVAAFGIEDSVILRQVNSARLFSPSGRMLGVWREEAQASIIERSAFDRSMADKACDRGARYVLGSRVVGIEVEADRVVAEVADDDGMSSFEAKVVVIASGFGSRLVERLGLGRVGDFVIGAQAEVQVCGLDEIAVYFGHEIAPGFFAWLVPVSASRALVGLLSRHSPSSYLRKLVTSMVAWGKVAPGEVEFSYGGIPLRPLTKTYGERVIVVGDAAGQVKPTSGGGIYYGLICADIAAETLHRALESSVFSARSLADYERQWRSRLGHELRVGYTARKLYERLSDGQIDRIFDIIKSNGIGEALLKAEELSFDWHGEVVLRLLKEKALSQIIDVMKIPLRFGGEG